MSDKVIQALLTLDRGAYAGVVVDGAAGAVQIAFLAEEAPELRVGSAVPNPVQFQGGGLEGPLALGGVVRSRKELAGRRVYLFAFDEPGRFARYLPPDQLPQFERRTWVRARPPSTAAVPVEVTGTSGPGTGVTLRGRLIDLSGGGLGVQLDADAERMLSRSEEVVVRLRRPGQEEVEAFGCRIANRAATDEGEIRYGLEFVQIEGVAATPPQGDYQPAWDCGACGSTLLLASSHPHCPDCGHARDGAPTYFPEWDDLVLDSEHWFTGADRTCAFCSSTFSEDARFCGGCGKPLV